MNGELECAACGTALGLGIPGSRKWCRECDDYVIARGAESDWSAVGRAAIAVGAGIAAGLIAKKILDHIFED
jgi:hypothetical protein